MGTLKAINPNITNFRDFPKYLKDKQNKPVAMFCTGGFDEGIRLLKNKGFKNVFQLKVVFLII